MSFSDNYQLTGADIQAANPGGVPLGVDAPGFGPGFVVPGSTVLVPGTQSPFQLQGTRGGGAWAPNFNSTFANPLQAPTQQITPGTSSPSSGTAATPGTGNAACAWSVFGFCLTQIFIVLLGMIFIAAGLYMFAGRSQAVQLARAIR